MSGSSRMSIAVAGDDVARGGEGVGFVVGAGVVAVQGEPSAWARGNFRQDVSTPRGAGLYHGARRIRRTVASLTCQPSRVSSPCTRRYPHPGFSPASRSTRSRTSRLTAGRPRRFGWPISW